MQTMAARFCCRRREGRWDPKTHACSRLAIPLGCCHQDAAPEAVGNLLVVFSRVAHGPQFMWPGWATPEVALGSDLVSK